MHSYDTTSWSGRTEKRFTRTVVTQYTGPRDGQWHSLEYRKRKAFEYHPERRIWGCVPHYSPYGPITYTLEPSDWDGLYYNQNSPGGYGLYAPYVRPTTVEDEAYAIATSRLARFLDDEDPRWNAGVFFGEARETVRLFTNTATRLYRSYRALRRAKVNHAWRILTGTDRNPYWIPGKSAANLWLEMRYGWRPLLSDLHNSMQYFATKSIERSLMSRTFRASGKAKRLRTIEDPYSSQKTIVEEASWFQHRYDLYPRFLSEPSSLDDLGLTNPFSIAWELVPFSFVADWFVNTGKVLESWTTFQRWEVKRGCQSRRSDVKVHNTDVPTWLGSEVGCPGTGTVPGQYEFSAPATLKLEDRFCERNITGVLPSNIPLRLTSRNPFTAFGRRPDGTQIQNLRPVDAVALLHTIFTSRGNHHMPIYRLRG